MFVDLTGKTFGKWYAIERAENDNSGGARYKCKCICGEIKTIRANTLRHGKTSSCGCDYRESPPFCDLPNYVTKENLKNYYKAMGFVGITFNRLELLKVIGVERRMFIGEFKCSCGTIVNTNISGVINSRTKSCGCLQKEEVSKLAKHNMTDTAIYRRWASIKARCKDVNDPVYGGKGITYDPSWESFDNFYRDMSEGFSPEFEIDRIDVTKGYSKENCRWVDHSENNFNKNIQENNTSGKTGVSFHKTTGKYRVYITKNGKVVHLGLFINLEDAVIARKNAEIDLYGYNRP